MKYEIIYRLVCMAYAEILRELLKKAIDNPNEEWDDIVLDMLDKLFNYQGE